MAAGAVAVLVVVGYWMRRSSLCRRRLMPLSRPSSIRPLELTARGLCGRRRESKWPADGGVRAMTHGLVCVRGSTRSGLRDMRAVTHGLVCVR